MSGRLILNLETIFALATVLLLLWNCRRQGGYEEVRATRFHLEGRDGLWMASVALLAAVVFWRAAHIYFLSDDFILVTDAQAFHGSFTPMFTHGGGDGFFRPLGYISLYLTWPWAGLDPLRWHWVGLTLHIVNAVLVYLLASWMRLSRMGAWFASALFALHGSHPEAALWIAGRFDVLATFFVLVALVAFIRLWEQPSWLAGLVASVAMSLGILSKESAYALPLMMLIFVASQAGSWSRRVRFLAPFFLLAASLFAYRWILQRGIGGYLTAEGKPQMLSLSLLPIAKALVLRLWAILFFPIDWATGASLWLLIATAVYAAIWLALAWHYRGTRAVVLVPLGFVLAAAIPPMQQLLIGPDLEKARLLYLPSVGFCLLAAAVVDAATPKLRLAAGIAILAFNLGALPHNLAIWEDAARRAKAVAETVASCSNPESVTGLPRTFNGVYFFANGLAESVRLQRSEHPGLPLETCSLKWDEKAAQLQPK